MSAARPDPVGEAGETRLRLEFVGIDRPPVELPLAGVLTIGSATGKADLLLDGQGVADVHCAIGRIKGGGWAIKDLGAEYGTLVNGERIQSARLRAGDLILIGSRRARVIDPTAPAGPAAAAAPKPASAQAPLATPSHAAPAGAAPAPPRPLAPTPSPAADRPATSMPRVAGYRIERPLGRGGMGQVYLAVQESLERRVAIKVLPEHLSADADFVRRFQAEARAAAALNHPNIVTVHDVWEHEGRHWLSMEYMDRDNLEARVVREGPLGWRDALEVLHDAAKGLVYAELRGIVHRDIKPANLMQNEVGTTKIADLGLATHLEAEATDAGDRKIFGTPHFIAPEQARGERVDSRCDLYSLGATMYRLLSGRTPFEGASTRDILRALFTEEPRSLREIAPDVPQELADIVMRLMRKKPEERYSSAGALLQEVDRLRSHSLHGISAPPTAGQGSRLSLLVGAVAVIALAAGAAWWMRKEGGGARGERTPQVGDVQGSPTVPAPEGPLAASAAPSIVAPTPAEEPPLDDDAALKRLDARALAAQQKLPPEMTPEERRAELLRLAEDYAGSTLAASFREEAAALEAQIQQAQALHRGAAEAAGAALTALREATRNEQGQPRALADMLKALQAKSRDPALAGTPGFADQLKLVAGEATRELTARAGTLLHSTNELELEGRFDELEERLAQARALLQADEVGEPAAALGIAGLPEIGRAGDMDRLLLDRATGMPAARERYGARKLAEEHLRIATGLGAPLGAGLEAELRGLDLDAATARVRALAATPDPGLRPLLVELERGLGAAKAVFGVLHADFEHGWKRRMINDPRSRGRANREAVGATAEGLLLRTEGGPELLAWSEFGGRTRELHQLFHERLNREWRAEELHSIAVLVSTAAVLQAIEEAEEMLQSGQVNVLTEEELRELQAGFELARPWAEQAGLAAYLEEERKAAELLARAFQAGGSSSWSLTVVSLERLLGEYRHTLLVRLLSDGRGLQQPAPANTGGQR